MSATDALQPDSHRRAERALAAGPEELAWRVLTLVNLSRLVVGSLLLSALVFVSEPQVVGAAAPRVAWLALLAMIGSALIEVPLLRKRILDIPRQTFLQFTLDVVIVSVLMHASGGVSSGVGGFLIVSVGALSLLVRGELAFLLAAVATLAILGEQSLAQWQGITGSAQFAPAGLLGAVLFVTTAAVQMLRQRIMATEALAEQRGVDLKNLAELNQYIIQHLRESIVVVDGEERIRLINESATGHLQPAARTPGVALADVSPALAQQLAQWRAQTGASRATAHSFASADGSTSIQAHFASLGSSPQSGVLIFLEDTSLLAERVQQSKLAALGRLSASIAHEIRNPIGAMSHAGQLLAEAPTITADEARLTDIIRVNARRVSQIVDSVLALSRRDRSRPEQLQLRPWLEDFALEFVKTLELFEGSVNVLPDTPNLVVYMDRTHLHQVVWNLCDNAVKYASAAAGAIAVELSCGRLEGSGRPYLDVADRGPGIDPERVEQVFEPFYTGQRGGTGLGLFISRELCESNGASLRYFPRPGGGSIFRLVFADPQRWQMSEGTQ
jgi:two-component system sensor histidine kinase PilS (NtrC family)